MISEGGFVKPKLEIGSDGQKFWTLNGKLHRLDGPAYENAYGCKAWLVNGVYHREDGPAREFPDGDKDWYLNGVKVRSYYKKDGG